MKYFMSTEDARLKPPKSSHPV